MSIESKPLTVIPLISAASNFRGLKRKDNLMASNFRGFAVYNVLNIVFLIFGGFNFRGRSTSAKSAKIKYRETFVELQYFFTRSKASQGSHSVY